MITSSLVVDDANIVSYLGCCLLLCVLCLIKAEGLRHSWYISLKLEHIHIQHRRWMNQWMMDWLFWGCSMCRETDMETLLICFSEEPLEQWMVLKSAIKHPHVTSLHLEVMVKSSACLREWLSAGRAPDNHTFAVIFSVTVQGFVRAWIALSQRAAVRSVADLEIYWSVWSLAANCCVGWPSAVKEHSVSTSC